MGKKQVFIKTGAKRALLEKLLVPYNVEINTEYEDYGYTVLEYSEEDLNTSLRLRCGVYVTAGYGSQQ